MPRRTLLSSEQRTRLFAISIDPAEMARHYVLSTEDLTVIRAKRRTVNRLGFAIQLCLLRYPGQGLRPDEHPPEAMIIFARNIPSRICRLRIPGSDPQGARGRVAAASPPAELRAGRLAGLPAGGHGRCVGHRSRRADRPGNARPSADYQCASARSCRAGADRIVGSGARSKEDL